jgi:tRNA dimethylallyltransferase
MSEFISMKNTSPAIVILGPTASGKSSLAIEIARKFNGEIISVDSRQVYKGMDIGSGKVTKAEQKQAPHHLLDIVDPNTDYNVTDFLRDAKVAEEAIRAQGKTPIFCGGTGFWIQAYMESQSFPGVKPNPELRERLGKLSLEELFAMVKEKDPARAKTIDRKNPIRLIRALEIIEVLGVVPPVDHVKIKNENYQIFAISLDRYTHQGAIRKRMKDRFKEGMVQEVERLEKSGVSFKRLEAFGLEYKYIALFLQKKKKRADMEVELMRETNRYAKRQITWLRRMESLGWKINWIKNSTEALSLLGKNAE